MKNERESQAMNSLSILRLFRLHKTHTQLSIGNEAIQINFNQNNRQFMHSAYVYTTRKVLGKDIFVVVGFFLQSALKRITILFSCKFACVI